VYFLSLGHCLGHPSSTVGAPDAQDRNPLGTVAESKDIHCCEFHRMALVEESRVAWTLTLMCKDGLMDAHTY
jgi:hypothetical protein